MSDYLGSLREKIRYNGMRKVASAIAAMPPASRLMSRICITGNSGLVGRMCKKAGDPLAYIDFGLGSSSSRTKQKTPADPPLIPAPPPPRPPKQDDDSIAPNPKRVGSSTHIGPLSENFSPAGGGWLGRMTRGFNKVMGYPEMSTFSMTPRLNDGRGLQDPVTVADLYDDRRRKAELAAEARFPKGTPRYKWALDYFMRYGNRNYKNFLRYGTPNPKRGGYEVSPTLQDVDMFENLPKEDLDYMINTRDWITRNNRQGQNAGVAYG